MTASARFKQADIRRAIKAAEGLGFEEVRVVFDRDGKMEVVVRKNASDEDMGVELK